jgi:hypothetical protein
MANFRNFICPETEELCVRPECTKEKCEIVMDLYKIEKNIPVFDKGGRKSRYPFNSMEIGDSFTVPKKEYYALCTSARNYRTRHNGFDFITRKDKNDPLKFRLWRTQKE